MESPLTQTICVKDFFFCERHGDELCLACHCDYRLRNNVCVEDELDTGGELFDISIEQRHSLNAYHHGAEPALDLIDEESYRCVRHKHPDCGECFDWAEIIKAETRALAERGGWLLSDSFSNSIVDLPISRENFMLESLALA